jgi:hypothetical protein
MFEVWSDGLGATSIFGNLLPAIKARQTATYGGPSLFNAVRSGAVKLSKYNPHHPVDQYGRPLPLAIAPAPPGHIDYHRGLPTGDETGSNGCPQGYWWGADVGCQPWPTSPFDLPRTGPPGYGADVPLATGISGITDTISSLWSSHPYYLLAGAAAAYFLFFGRRRR